jgi:hypothetical protein
VLADKPWLISAADFPKLEKVMALAAEKRLVAYDIMTERSEITTILQRELARDPQVAGTVGPGSEREPAVEMESTHNILKLVAGAPNLRPAWFFDVGEQGEALAGRRDAPRRPGAVAALPGAADRLQERAEALRREPLGNAAQRRRAQARDRPQGAAVRADVAHEERSGSTTSRTARPAYTVRGVYARVRRAGATRLPAGAGDTHTALVRGQPRAPRGAPGRRAEVAARALRHGEPAAERREAEGRARAPRRGAREGASGLAVADEGQRLRVVIPERYRVGHEAHFAEVTERFLAYLKDPSSMPRWEAANQLAKYKVTTEAFELSRR